MSSSPHASVQSFNPESLLPQTAYTSVNNPAQSTAPDTPSAELKPNSPIWNHRPRGRKNLINPTFELTKSLVLPLVAITYLAFCYVVANRTVPLTSTGIIDTSPKHLASVKSGITAISILIITVGLWPLRSLIDDLKTEEFFRTLHTHSNGVPISTLNGISNPSFGLFETVKAMVHKHCTLYFATAFIARFLATATATLAPAALTIEPVLWDTDLMAFKVGAVGRDTVFNVSTISPYTMGQVFENTQEAASIAWAETVLGLQYGFTEQGNISTGVMSYITPYPADLSPSTPARWITDVIALHPVCVWATTNVTKSIFFKTNDLNETAVINLAEVGLDVDFHADLSNFSVARAEMLDPTLYLTNHTNRARPSDGSVVWRFQECLTGCSYNNPQFMANIHFDFTGVPTFQYENANSTWRGAFLVCSPRPGIETHEIRNDGHGHMTAHSNRQYSEQSNLHAAQTSLLLSLALSDIPDHAGPSFLGLQPKVQASLFFGTDQINSVNTSVGDTTLIPAPLPNITNAYTRLLQSSMKIFVNGKFGTAYVPGRISKEVVVFRSSLPYVAASTVLFAILTILLLVAHLRQGKGEKFTLFSVAAALDRSEIPGQLAQMKRDLDDPMETNRRQDERRDDNLVDSFGSKVVSLTKDGDDASVVLHWK